MNSLQDLLRQNVVLALVQRNITCPVTGEVLDVRTCVVLTDADGDPAGVLSQKGWRAIADGTLPDVLDKLRAQGIGPDQATVKGA